ncbi:hypothetical protein BU15DRAFT_82327 [Melanogaster broomeanus]|nr:hypothetical protein BU15DRAFT_82327 [Melanogaster broomeanus]
MDYVEVSDDDPSLIEPRFHPSEWIGQGKTYPAADTPAYIIYARKQLLTIPPSFHSHLPAIEMTILELLNENLPAQPSMLNTALGQAWFDGARSIIDFRYVNSRLPLWVITYWTEMSITLRKRNQWETAHRWLIRIGQEGKMPCLAEADSAREAMASLSWGKPVDAYGGGGTPEFLLPLLSDDQWLNDEIIDLAMQKLTERTHLTQSAKTTIIAPLLFSEHLRTLAQDKDVRSSYLERYASFFHEGLRTILYLPAHVNNNHWIALRINFTTRIIEIDDESPVLSSGQTISNRSKLAYHDDRLASASNQSADHRLSSPLHATSQNSISTAPSESPHLSSFETDILSCCDSLSIISDVKSDVLSQSTPTNPINSPKRKRAESEASSHLGHGRWQPSGPKIGVVGISQSAQSERQLRIAATAGNLNINPKKQKSYENTCQGWDRQARFDYLEGWKACHSCCGKWIKQKAPYNTTRFGDHVQKCKAKAASMLTSFGFMTNSKSVDPWTKTRNKKVIASTPIVLPCLGITEFMEPRISQYIYHTGASGGGARTLHVLARELYGDEYYLLQESQKIQVQTIHHHEKTWTIDRVQQRVFSTKCMKTISSSVSPPLCLECHNVFHSKAFKNVLRVPTPADKNYKYLNSQYRPDSAGHVFAKTQGLHELIHNQDAKNSVCIRYAIGVLEGKYSGTDIFTGMMEAMVQASERHQRGVGHQNFKYSPALEQFAHMCAIISPEVYRFMKKSFQLPTHRHFQIQRSRTPKFPLTICDDTFLNAHSYIVALNYMGPLGLSCDDTKLYPALRTYWDANTSSYYLVGHTGDPLAIANADELHMALQTLKDKKATKLRLWVLVIPLPKVPPIILAAKAIPNDLAAPELVQYSLQIITGLRLHGLSVMSYACDGTEVERAVQRLLEDAAPSHIIYHFKHPGGHLHPDLNLKIPTFDGLPLVVIQDSQHGLKTARNNLFSGACLLTLGNHIAMYSYARDLAFEPGAPLYHRDVEKLDRQDDNAATRLFSADTLDYVCKKHRDRIGQIVYLFIFGELIDAYQNRHIPHAMRIQMAFRARAFIDLWELFIKAAGYTPSRHLISRESLAIFKRLVDGLISLLHSSEVCEHIFGECRKLVKDFNFLNFIHMIPRLLVLVHAAIELCHSRDPWARASGYAHTYFDSNDINIAQLVIFPTDEEIAQCMLAGWEEAQSLFVALGISPNDILHSQTAGEPLEEQTTSDSDTDGISRDDFEDVESEAWTLQRIMDQEQYVSSRAHEVSEKMRALTCAVVAVELDSDGKVFELQEPTEEERETWISKDTATISSVLTSAIPSRPSDLPPMHHKHLDLSTLVQLRRDHQTKRAATSVRVHLQIPETADSDLGDQDVLSKNAAGLNNGSKGSIRLQVIRQMEEVLCDFESKSQAGCVNTAGLERQVRWTGTLTAAERSTGNTANAALAAGQRAFMITRRREKVFRKFHVPQLQQLVDGLVNSPNSAQPQHDLLMPNSWGIVAMNDAILIGKVLAIYVRGGGKNAAHAWQSHVKSIGSVSYLAMQVYEPSYYLTFRAVHHCNLNLQAFKFIHISSDHFLRRISGHVELSQDLRTLTIHEDIYKVFSELRDNVHSVKEAIQELTKARRRHGTDEDSQ